MKTQAVRLSPVNFFGMAKQVRIAADAFVDPTEKRRIEEVVMYRCPECHELHEWEDDAEKCCKPSPKDQEVPRCPVCGEAYSEHRDAADCCLWKDIDAMTRWRIADAVEAGSDWATELGLLTTGFSLTPTTHKGAP